jgi:DNA-directed RNA polymerases I, II, and III subunit RPABC1
LLYAELRRRQKLRFYARAPATSEIQLPSLYVEFSTEASVSVAIMKSFVHTLDDQKFGAGILIYTTSLTSQAGKIIQTIAGQFRIEAFPESELLVNITHHELVPRHIVMTSDEKKELLARYRLKETQLPRIQLADPVARYYGLRRGQVVKIIRTSETAGRYASYRICM